MNVLSIDIGIRNFAICLLNENEILYWEIIELEKSCKKINWNHLIKVLNEKLVAIINKFQVDKVLIEQQMTARMKMLSIGALMFFISKDIDAEIISATEKLKYFEIGRGKKNYRERKKLAVSLTRFYISQEKYCKWLGFFNKHKKKDDLSDSFLYSFNYFLF